MYNLNNHNLNNHNLNNHNLFQGRIAESDVRSDLARSARSRVFTRHSRLYSLDMTTNDYSLPDSFNTVTQINNIPKQLFQGYQFVSFDVVSLFTNVPLSHSSDYFRLHLQRETH